MEIIFLKFLTAFNNISKFWRQVMWKRNWNLNILDDDGKCDATTNDRYIVSRSDVSKGSNFFALAFHNNFMHNINECWMNVKITRKLYETFFSNCPREKRHWANVEPFSCFLHPCQIHALIQEKEKEKRPYVLSFVIIFFYRSWNQAVRFDSLLDEYCVPAENM